MPPTLFVKDTDSLAEQIQREFPDAKVVKTLNTMTASLMVNPRQLVGGAHSTFISGDDTDAKDTVTALLTELGHADIIDLGGISTARGPEMLVKIWLELWDALGTYEFGIKIVRLAQPRRDGWPDAHGRPGSPDYPVATSMAIAHAQPIASWHTSKQRT